MKFKPRSLKQLQAYYEEVWEKVWYERHKRYVHTIEDKKVLLIAKKAAKRIEKKYGKKNIPVGDSFEMGVLNGRLATLSWCLCTDSNDKNFFDT